MILKYEECIKACQECWIDFWNCLVHMVCKESKMNVPVVLCSALKPVWSVSRL